MNNLQTLFLLLFFSASLVSCQNDDAKPKPRGYFRIGLPSKVGYVKYKNEECDFSFEYPDYAEIQRYEADVTKPCWFNLSLKPFNGKLHLSYYRLNNDLPKYLEQTRDLAYRHTMKAQYINEQVFSNPKKKVYGLLYEIGGNAASSCQFYVTDSAKHFFRGALYFNCRPNADSLQPVNEYVTKDIIHIIESFEWNN